MWLAFFYGAIIGSFVYLILCGKDKDSLEIAKRYWDEYQSDKDKKKLQERWFWGLMGTKGGDYIAGLRHDEWLKEYRRRVFKHKIINGFNSVIVVNPRHDLCDVYIQIPNDRIEECGRFIYEINLDEHAYNVNCIIGCDLIVNFSDAFEESPYPEEIKNLEGFTWFCSRTVCLSCGDKFLHEFSLQFKE